MNPHAGKTRLKPELEKATRAAREAAAEVAFALETIREKMHAAGRDGFMSCVVGPARQLNLKDTAAAKAALDWLNAEGFGHGWEQRPATEAGRPGAEIAFDLMVTWQA